MKPIIALSFFCALTVSLMAQRYNTAAGLRVSRGVGVTVQQRIASQWTVEGIAFTNIRNNHDLIALGEYHGKIVFQKRLNWYAGAGMHVGSMQDVGSTYGMAFIGGVEFTMRRFNVSVDYMPIVNFSETPNVFEATPAISVRYVLWERPKNNVIQKLKDKREDRKKDREKKKNGKETWKDKIFKPKNEQ